MTDEEQPPRGEESDEESEEEFPEGPDEEFEESELRDRLRAARHTDPVPDDVADRLEGTLADLVAERGHGVPPPAPLARRWRAPQVLAAAAAIVVIAGGTALGITQLGHNDTEQGLSTSASGEAEVTQSPKRAEQPKAGSAGSGTDLGKRLDKAGADLPRLHSGRFHADVRRLLTAPHSTLGVESGPAEPKASVRAHGLDCARPPGPGRTRPILLDGSPATLVVRDADGGRTVRAVSCDGDRVLARTRLSR